LATGCIGFAVSKVLKYSSRNSLIVGLAVGTLGFSFMYGMKKVKK